MQVTANNIQRPKLFNDFFTEELIWNSEYLTYIYTSIHKVIKKATSTLSNSTIKTMAQLREELDNLCNLSKKLFKTLPASRIEFDEIQNKISKLLRSSSEKKIIKENPITHYPDNYFWLNRCPLFINDYEDKWLFIYRDNEYFHFVRAIDCKELYEQYIETANAFSIFKIATT